jgi:hypothetical protein
MTIQIIKNFITRTLHKNDQWDKSIYNREDLNCNFERNNTMPHAADKEDLADELLAQLELLKHNLVKRYEASDSVSVRATIIATLYDIDEILKLAKEKTG